MSNQAVKRRSMTVILGFFPFGERDHFHIKLKEIVSSAHSPTLHLTLPILATYSKARMHNAKARQGPNVV
ncbi:MAG: hypothetical protein AAFN12_08805, partial [Cyanobacteria bacterium J06560_2]